MDMTDPRDGLEWVHVVGSADEPRWTKEPALDAVNAVVQSELNEEQDVEATFHSEGAFNKMYVVDSASERNLMLRVPLPVDPQYKTLSEVATLQFVRLNTSIPVPRPMAFNVRPGFPFEWMLMERMPGQPLGSAWMTLSWEAKCSLVKKVAEYLAELNKIRFSAIGNLYQSSQLPVSSGDTPSKVSSNPPGDEYVVGRISSVPFFNSHHFEMDVPRGPFASSREWLASQLLFHADDAERMLTAATHEEDIKFANTLQSIVQRLQKHLETFFPPEEDALEEYTLHHDDVSSQNLLVDHEGHLTALVDWECVSAVPLYRTVEWPCFLEDGDSELEDYPDPKEFAKVNGSLDGNRIYQDRVLEYEQGRLRPIFLEHMKKLSPDWTRVLADERLRRKADFEFAVRACAGYLLWPGIEEWLDSMEEGEYYNLKDLP